MKAFLLLLASISFVSFSAEKQQQISTIDFVEVLDKNMDEALYYYQNNWLVLRQKALKKGFIASYDFVEIDENTEQPFHVILTTTYSNEAQFLLREKNFRILINESGGIKLKNTLTPEKFRKVVFSPDRAKHWQ